MAESIYRGFCAVIILWLPILATAAAPEAGQPCRVRVIEGRAAVYATTNRNQAAVAWLPGGSEFVVRGELTDDAWVRIEPPTGVSAWIYRELVQAGHVVADKSRIRAGAGLAYPPVAGLNKGDRVDVLGTYGDWLRIRPPAGLDFWVLRDQVEPLALLPPGGEGTVVMSEEAMETTGSVAEASAAIMATNAPSEAVAVTSEEPSRLPIPLELSGFVLEDAPGQGAKVVLQGTLDWGGVGAVSAPFCLVARQSDGETLPICHLLAPMLPYGSHIGASATVEGTRWRVKGSALPMVIPEQVRFVE